MSTWNNVRVDRVGDTAHVVLDRPDRGNALDLETAIELNEAVRAAAASDARHLVLRGEGPRFCVGGDLQGFRDAAPGANLCDVLVRPIHEAIEAMHAARQPVIGLVHGAVGGGGVGLVLAADITVAAVTTSFRLGYTASGLSPDCSVTWELPRRVGLARAMDLTLTNRRFTAVQAEQWGLVSRAVEETELDATLEEVLESLRRVPVDTLSESKRLLRRAAVTDLHTQLDDEARTIGRIGDTDDAREAIAAFLDKRTPTFGA